MSRYQRQNKQQTGCSLAKMRLCVARQPFERFILGLWARALGFAWAIYLACSKDSAHDGNSWWQMENLFIGSVCSKCRNFSSITTQCAWAPFSTSKRIAWKLLGSLANENCRRESGIQTATIEARLYKLGAIWMGEGLMSIQGEMSDEKWDTFRAPISKWKIKIEANWDTIQNEEL